MIVSVADLSHRYGARTALAHVSFEVKEGELFGLLGPNGGGKLVVFTVAHVAVGALTLAVSVLMAIQVFRYVRRPLAEMAATGVTVAS